MWQTDDLIIISDLHLAAERDKGLFQADAELANFLGWVLEEVPGGVVFLNGDVLDFLVVESEESADGVFDLTRMPARAEAIFEKHDEVFSALAKLAQSPRHDLFIAGGNHDPELALPGVQAALERRLATRGVLGQHVRWLVQGEAGTFRVGEANILVEHGDIYDPWNKVDHEALRRALMLETRGLDSRKAYKTPPGSRLVVNHLTELRGQYPWVDLLKPERQTVVPLLYAFASVKQKVGLRKVIGELTRVMTRSLVAEAYRALNRPQGLYRAAPEQEAKRKRFNEWAASVEREATRGILKGDVEDRIESLLPRLRKVSVEDKYFDIESPDEAAGDVALLLKSGADAVVNGHTHAAKACKVADANGLYLNSGTWGRLMRLPKSEDSDENWRHFLKELSEGRGESFAHPTFVRITRGAKGTETHALLSGWHEQSPSPLASWKFDSVSRGWSREG